MYILYDTYMTTSFFDVSFSAPVAPHSPAVNPPELLAFFVRLLPRKQLWKLLVTSEKRFYSRLFTPIVTLWYLIFQRLGFDSTLQAVVTDARTGGADSLSKHLSKRLRSNATTSFSDARQRLPLSFLSETLTVQATQIVNLTAQSLWRGLQVSLLDGSTIRLRPYGDIPEHFPPHGNQHKSPPYWCLMRVVVGFCAFTGAALRCRFGSLKVSEQTLACELILEQAFGSWLYIGDRNFGVYRIVQTVHSVGSHALVRLTEQRARKLLGRSLCTGQHPVRWSPTRHDQLQPGCSQEPVAGQVVVVRVRRNGFRPFLLYLFSTLPISDTYPVEALARLYGVRWHIELNLRYLKDQMKLAQLECKSADMAQKEWLAGLLAYNLVRAAMLCATLTGSLSPLDLSFSASRRICKQWLALAGQGRQDSLQLWRTTLELILQSPLPRRRKPRPSEPRRRRRPPQPFPLLIGSRQNARDKLKLSLLKY